MPSVLFVCTANICRSPMAEGALRALLDGKGIDSTAISIDSAGTHDYQAGSPPFVLAAETAKKRGFDISKCIARRVTPADFDRFDHILAMDYSNLENLKIICPTRCKHKIELLLEYGDEHHGKEIPDPYGRAPEAFEQALDMIEDGCRGLALILSRAV